MGKKRRTRKRQSSMDLRRNGLKAFEQRDYTKAIEAWERVRRQTPDMLPPSALAEAYFRRGIHRLYATRQLQAGLDDLRQAVDLQPDDLRTIYHLGLAAHRQSHLDDAIHHYRTVRQSDGDLAGRAAYPLALALLQRGEDPAQAPVWGALDDEERVMLDEVSAFSRRPYTLSDDAPLLWRGIAALDTGDTERAGAALQHGLERATTPAERQMAHYYQGVLAAQHEGWEAALRAWNAARAAGLTMDRLEENLQEGYHRLAEERLERGDVEGALLAGEEALRRGPAYPSLEALVSHAHQRLAHQAVSDGRWAEARKHWEKADAAEDGSFRLAYNLALAHERSEDFLAAGERWREALRRRPRSDDHPDALTDDQVARLWQRAAEAYTKAGEFDEAVQVYRNAVKWNPDRLEARLALSEALLLNGQSEAAGNELQRILDRDPDNVPALLRMGEVIYTSWHWWMGNPVHYWERVLELEPDNVAARQLLVDFYQDQAENALRWGDHVRALWMYEEALSHWPGNARVSAAMGALYVRLDEVEKARPHIERALGNASDDLRVYEQILRAWFDVDDPDEAWRVMEQAEARIDPMPYEFYISQASYCIDRVDEAVPLWLDRAVEKAPPGAPVFEAIGEMAAMNQAFALARAYLERAIESNQEPGQAHLVLSLVALQEGDTARAEIHWSDALKIARRTHDEELMERVEHARFMLHMPPDLLGLIERFGPEAFMDGSLPEFLYDELDEW
jgi:tetratricopeptide (TPR) repeat protein